MSKASSSAEPVPVQPLGSASGWEDVASDRSWANTNLPALSRGLSPLVDVVARFPASIHAKLLAGFLAGALLLLGMGILGTIVTTSMERHVNRLMSLAERVDLTRRMEYLVTAQSHWRAMALLTGDESNFEKIAAGKQEFRNHLASVEGLSDPSQAPFFQRVRAIDARFAESDAEVLALYRDGNVEEALRLHLEEEHPVSHELEDAMRVLQTSSIDAMAEARAAVDADRVRFAQMVAAFSGTSVIAALLLGFILSWSIIRPVRRINRTLAAVSQGHFDARAEVDNRDELGALGRNVNALGPRLADLYGELRAVSESRQAVIDHAMDGIITVDAEGRVASFSPAAEIIFGYDSSEMVGERVDRVIPDFSEVAGLHGRSGSSGSSRSSLQDLTARHKDGTTFPVELSVGGAASGDGGDGSVLIVRDATERVRFQKELAQAHDAALEANQAKSRFLANMSHELRTPLNAIIGYSEMLEEEARDLGQEGFVPDLQKIQSAGKHLLGLINAVLDLSKIEAGKMDLYLESFDMATLVNDTLPVIKPLAAKNGNTVTADLAEDLGTVRADLTKVRQVMLNVLANACKFTSNGTISVAARREADGGREWIVVDIADTGIGMTPEQLGRLFKEFSQADSTVSSKFGGTGLGLALSQRLCQLMGGAITVSSEPGKGSTFTVRFPARVEDPSDAVQAPAEAQAASGGPNTVLVVDDDAAVRELLTRMLTKSGFRVVAASGGEEGLRLAKQISPEAIVLDVMMQDVDGWTVLSRLKADPEVAEIPVIMLSVIDDKNLGYALGASDYMTKPIDRERLVSVLRKQQAGRRPGAILVIENDDSTRAIMRRTFEHEGWSVVEAENGLVGLQRLREGQFGAIVLDLMMPEMDGFEFVSELQKDPEGRKIPVVVVTAKDLTVEERARLRGYVERVVDKEGASLELLAGDVRSMIESTIRSVSRGASPSAASAHEGGSGES